MQTDPVQGITSIGRPLDRNVATNRAVLQLMPIAGIVAAVVALVRGASLSQIVWWGIAGVLLVLGAWALTRELAPDDDAAALVSIALGFLTLPLVMPLSLLVLFATMLLIRIVNRTVGLRARVTDSGAITLAVFAVMYLTGNPGFGCVAAMVFVLDAVLSKPLRRQWIFAAVCLLGSLAFFGLSKVDSLMPSPVHVGVISLLAAVSLAYVVTLLRTRTVESRGDVTGVRLAASRVRSGMFVALLVAWQALLFEEQGVAHAVIVWSALGGVAVTAVVIRPLKKLAT
jgi:hypothetical protein